MSVNSDTEKMTFELEEFKEVLNYQAIPTEKERPTVFDISSYPHYENVISSWYAFFLDADNPHGLGSLFYSSLLELLYLEGRGGGSCEVTREYGTDEGGRIDLLVFEGLGKGGKFQYPIIIENKIYADLDGNDLKDYFDSVSKKSCNTPAKLVLSLRGNEDRSEDDIGEKVRKNGYEVRSHQRYMDVIKKNLHSYIVDADPKYFMLLQDFMNNIEKMTMMKKMNGDSKYYFSEAEKIDRLLEVRKNAHAVVIDNAYSRISPLEGWTWGKSDSGKGRFDFSKENTGASFYVRLIGMHYSVKLWMNRELSDLWESIDETQQYLLLKNLYESTQGVQEKCTEKGVLGAIKYDIQENELDKYGDLVFEGIDGDFSDLLRDIWGNNAK